MTVPNWLGELKQLQTVELYANPVTSSLD
jgi:hypothetical protein